MQNQKTVLVTGVGAIIGYGILHSLKASKYDLHIIGIDIYDDAVGQEWCDTFIQGIPANDPDFIPYINQLVAERQIDLIIPGIEPDIQAFMAAGEQLKAKWVHNQSKLMELCTDKLDFYRYLENESDWDVIPTLQGCSFEQNAEQLGLPFLIKPRKGSASKGIRKIHTKREFDFYTESDPDAILCQKVIGDEQSEYTLAVFGTGDGSFKNSILLRRVLSKDGSTSKAWVENNAAIMEYAAKLCQVFRPIGPTNMQFRMEDGKPYILEINPRISSACSIRTSFGYNEPEMCLSYFLLGELPEEVSLKSGRAVRYIKDQIHYD
ncbi:ATP-grasp domain-containing protein [bacterium SCSIO 12741]|nr:ATP-grasp domain-containing protein [bacterium SCSIO 12741]